MTERNGDKNIISEHTRKQQQQQQLRIKYELMSERTSEKKIWVKQEN